MKVGDMVQCVVSVDNPDTTKNKQLKKGRVVYIHPRGRFVTVEFDFHGKKVRECFFRHELN